jgi:hypothetical protein
MVSVSCLCYPTNAHELLTLDDNALRYAFAFIAYVVQKLEEMYIEVRADMPMAVGNYRMKQHFILYIT